MTKLKTDEFIVNMGPHHPSTHGVCRLMLTLDGERVQHVEPKIGYLHRSIEKISENRTYAQCMPLTDRIEYVTSMAANYVLALGVEKLKGIEVPERAEYIRVIMLELNRITSHLLWYGVTAMDLGALTPFLYGLREREAILDLFEMTCGQRLTYNYIRIGGVSKDLPKEFIPRCREVVKLIRGKMSDYEGLLNENPIWKVRNIGVGAISAERAIAWGLSGHALRAAGVKYDVRKVDPYSVYEKFDFEVPIRQNGDNYDRYIVRLEEIKQSLRIIEQALDGMPEGEIMAPKINAFTFKPNEGEVYSRIEAARGEMGVYIRSDGTTKPVRIRYRGGSYNHLQALPEMGKGLYLADIVAIMATLDIIMPEVDR
jgi:NADH-quinone oxidoreductase subunit D